MQVLEGIALQNVWHAGPKKLVTRGRTPRESLGTEVEGESETYEVIGIFHARAYSMRGINVFETSFCVCEGGQLGWAAGLVFFYLGLGYFRSYGEKEKHKVTYCTVT